MLNALLEDRAAQGDPDAQVALAQRMDQDGRHAEAIDWLARASKASHAPALRILGMRLSIGDNAPGLPREGAALIRQAAALGDGPALSTLATFAAIGYLQPQDWQQAISFLRAAAEQDFAPAREQLRVLMDGPNACTSDGGDVSIANWRTVPEPRMVSASPHIMSIERFISPAICDVLINLSRDRLVRAEVFDPISGLAIIEETRTNRISTLGLFDSNLLSVFVQARIASALAIPEANLEAPSVLNYQPGEQARDHFDFIDPAAQSYALEVEQRGQRIATFLIYLNDDYEGGETAFPVLDIRHRGRKGDALFFFNVDAGDSPDRRTVHAGRAPLTEEKWVLSQFIRNKAQI